MLMRKIFPISCLLLFFHLTAKSLPSDYRDLPPLQPDFLNAYLDFSSASTPFFSLPVEERIKVHDQFFSVDPFSLTPLWRTAFLKVRLNWDHLAGNVDDFVAMKEKLLNLPKAEQAPQDVEVLIQIARQYMNSVFAPPNDYLRNQDMNANPPFSDEWYTQNFQSYAEAEKVLQHVVDSYDPTDAAAASALHLLGQSQAFQEKNELAKDTYARLEHLDVSKLKGHASIENQILVSSDTLGQRFEEESANAKKSLPVYYLRIATNLAGAEREQELNRLAQKYPQDEKIKAALRQISTRQISVEEMVTSPTLRDAGYEQNVKYLREHDERFRKWYEEVTSDHNKLREAEREHREFRQRLSSRPATSPFR